MPNAPSRRALSNQVDLYAYAPGQDAEAGLVPTYTLAAQGVPASVQQVSADRMSDQERVSGLAVFEVFLYSVAPRLAATLSQHWKVIWRDNAGVTRTLFVSAQPEDLAGKGRAWCARCQERV